MDGWAYTYTLPASMASGDPSELTERIIDKLIAEGYTWQGGRPEVALSSVQEDGTRQIYVNTDTDPSALFVNLTLGTVSARVAQQRQIQARLLAYLNNPSPGNAESVQAIKDLIRVVRFLWQAE